MGFTNIKGTVFSILFACFSSRIHSGPNRKNTSTFHLLVLHGGESLSKIDPSRICFTTISAINAYIKYKDTYININEQKMKSLKYNLPGHVGPKFARNLQMIFRQEEHIKMEHNQLNGFQSQNDLQELLVTTVL